MKKNIIPKSDKQRPLNQRISFWTFILLLVVAIAILLHIGRDIIQNHRIPPQTVLVDKSQTRDMPVYLPALGTVTPTYTVTVRTQINGQLLQVLFREGQMVKAGDLLAQIDPRPYLAQLTQYEGQLTRDLALLSNAQRDLNRYQTLWKQDSISKQTLDTQASLVKQNEGTVQLDQGLIQNTKLNLLYTRITSPVNGRIGLRLVDPGNYVQVSDVNGLAIVDTLSPITIIFTLPEDNVSDILEQLNAGRTLSVKAYDRTQTHLLATGTLLTIDNQIDTATGTVKLKATFQNKDNKLFPNQFVNIRLLVKTLPRAIVVPTPAIQFGPQGSAYVYVVDKNNIAKVRSVVPGITEGNLTVITSGLKTNETVVVEGTDKLVDGVKVIVGKA